MVDTPINLDDYLFHYTTVESLSLILKNGTIRFRSLDKMDDLQEKETADVENIGQFCYVSSWTDDKTESIPMYININLVAIARVLWQNCYCSTNSHQ